MPRIPIIIPYHEDELLYSWVYRLAKANGFDNMRYFIATYIQNKPYKPTSTLLYDLQNLTGLTDSFSLSDVIKIFHETTLYPYFLAFMSEEYQTFYLNSFFRIQSSTSDIRYASFRLFKDLYYCPLCREEEIKRYGEFYYHRSHQLPNVRYCTKHACLLHKYNGKSGNEFKITNKKDEIKFINKDSIEYRFAVFCDEFLNSKVNLNANDVKRIIKEKLTDIHLPNNLSGNETYIERLKKNNIFKLISEDELRYFLTRKTTDKSTPTTVNYIYLLFDLFDSINEIPNNNKLLEPLFDSLLCENNYELISEHRSNLIVIRHNACGYSFITTPYALLYGWECPKCDLTKSDQEIIQRLIAKIDNNNYELVSEFRSWKEKLLIRHKECGKIIEYSPKVFLINSTRCPCTHHLTYKDVKDLVEKTREFELVNFSNTNEPMTIKHKFCGSTFETIYYDFYRYPHCKKCKLIFAISPKTADEFYREMKKVTSDQYQVIGDYTHRKSILLKHIKCGTQFHTTAYKFLTGKRCPNCHKNIRSNKMKDFISETSKGRYEAIGDNFSREIIVIKDKENEKVLELPKKLIIQELTRPTPSRLLPAKKKKINQQRFADISKFKKFEKKVIHHLATNSFIHLEDMRNDTNYNYNTLIASFQKLEKKGTVKRVYPGVFTLSENNFTEDDVITSRFINRNGNIIGYYYGPSFMYSLGFGDLPEKIWITSTREPQMHGRNYKMFNRTIRVKRSRILNLNSRAINILPVLDRLADTKKPTDEEIICLRKYLAKNQISYEEVACYLPFYTKKTEARLNTLYFKEIKHEKEI